MWHWPYVVAGSVVGLVVGLAGIGGGSLMTPLLILFFRQLPVVAVGTDLVFAALTKSVATAAFGYKRHIDWPLVARLAAGSLPASALTLAWLNAGQARDAVIESVVTQALGVMLLGSAAGMVLQTSLATLAGRVGAQTLRRLQSTQPVLTVLAGILLGVAVTLTSVGAGAIGTLALLCLYPLRLSPSRLVATELAHALPLTIVAGAGHAVLGHVDYGLLANLLAGSVPGVLVGTMCATRAPGWLLRGVLATLLVVSGVRLLSA